MITNKFPFVSIIINCYNGSKYLSQAIESILAQTIHNWEIILWDNQSIDESANIFQSYQDKRLRYFYADKHSSLGEARNLAVQKAQGSWIAFLDCDDLWLPNKLEKQIALIQEGESDLGLVYGNMEILIESEAPSTKWVHSMKGHTKKAIQESLPQGNIFYLLLKRNFVPLLSALIRRDAYWSVGGIDPQLNQAEDYDLFLKVARLFKARAIDESICRYRIHASNLSHKQMQKGHEEILHILSRYLPDVRVKKALRVHESAYAIYQIREGFWKEGLIRFIKRGDISFIGGKVKSRLKYKTTEIQV